MCIRDSDGADLRVGKDIPRKHFAKVDTAFVKHDRGHDSQVAGLADGGVDARVFAAAGIHCIVAAGIAATGFLAAGVFTAEGIRIRGTGRATGCLLYTSNREAEKKGLTARILLELNVAREESKYGILEEDLDALLQNLARFQHIRVEGLMTVAPFVENPEENRKICGG